MRFEVDDLVRKCRSALEATPSDPASVIGSVLCAAIRDPIAIAEAILDRGITAAHGFDVFWQSDALTIFQVTVPPKSYGAPHNHGAWAVIGVYEGAEHYSYYIRKGRRVILSSEETVFSSEVKILDVNTIHAMSNPFPSPSASIHIYGNNHFEARNRSIWSPHDMLEQPFDATLADRWFEELSARRNRNR